MDHSPRLWVGCRLGATAGKTVGFHPGSSNGKRIHIVLAISFFFESASFGIAFFKEFLPRVGNRSFMEAIHRSTDLTMFVVLIENAAAPAVQSIRDAALEDRAVESVAQPLTMHLGPEEVLVHLKVNVRDGLPGSEIPAAVDRIEQAIRARQPVVKRIFLEAGSLPSIQVRQGARGRARKSKSFSSG
jgi:hypothetical protein